jgi:hypothetical protein
MQDFFGNTLPFVRHLLVALAPPGKSDLGQQESNGLTMQSSGKVGLVDRLISFDLPKDGCQAPAFRLSLKFR